MSEPAVSEPAVSEPAVSEPAEPLPGQPFDDPLLAELHLGEPRFPEPLFEEPLFADPVLEPISPPHADLAAVPVRRGPAGPGAALPRTAGPGAALPRTAGPGPALPGLALPGLALPAAVLSGAVLLEGLVGEPAPAQPATAQPAAAHPATAGQAHPPTRVPAGRVVSGRGVTGRGVVVLVLFLTGLVGLLEVVFAHHRGAAFAIAFVLSSAAGALVVRRRDLPTSLIAPPLLYCVLIVALSVVDTHDQSGGFITREGVYIGNAFVTGAPTLWAGTAAAAAIAWYRRHAGRKPHS